MEPSSKRIGIASLGCRQAQSLPQAGVILSDYATLMVEILKDNGRREADAIHGAPDMPWATLVEDPV